MASNDLNYSQRIKYLESHGIRCLYNPFYTNFFDIIQENNFDYVLLSRSTVALKYLWAVRQILPLAKIIFLMHDLSYLREAREIETVANNDNLHKESLDFFKAQELHCVNSADLTLVLSTVELKILQTSLPKAKLGLINFIMDLHPIIPKYE